MEQVEGKSLSSILTDDRLHFILQKNERRAPEQSLEGPGVMSVFTGKPAGGREGKEARERCPERRKGGERYTGIDQDRERWGERKRETVKE